MRGEWVTQAGFSDGMPIKIRVMPDCIVITAQNTREQWGCAEGLSVTRFSKKKMEQWIQSFPGCLTTPAICRCSREGTGILGKCDG
ncbi:SymE family type I addiction module toxin [Edwardsiella anguillarum]|nr:SymE family type I addiction module toxin [Edwardsiella anguillarum]